MSEAEKPTEIVTLENGICLRIKSFPPALIRQAVARIERPQPPKFVHEDKGGIEEENLGDPAYQDALTKYEAETTEAAIDTMYVAGTEVESVPEGIFGLEDEGWQDLLDFLHIEFSKDGKFGTYLAWLKLYAMSKVLPDTTAVITAVSRKIGLSEKEVDDAVDSFRGGKMGGANNGVPSEDSGDGDNVPKTRAKSGSGGRRKRGS